MTTDMDSNQIKEKYGDKIEEIVSTQRNRNREAMFFMYEDGSTSEIIVGESNNIRVSKDRQRSIFSSGNVIGSVHTHPAGFDPSTIDIMTAVNTNQDHMCVAVPIVYDDGSKDYTLSTLNLAEMGKMDKRRLFRAMRRCSVNFTYTIRDIRKHINIDISKAKLNRTHEVIKDGYELPVTDRPSFFEFKTGKELGVVSSDDLVLA